MTLDEITPEAARKLVRQAYPAAVKLEGTFSGGNDEGGYNGWRVIDAAGLETEIGQEPSGIVRDPYYWEQASGATSVPVSLSELLDEAFEGAHGYGSFAGEFEVNGTVSVDLLTGDTKVTGEVGYTHWESF